MQDLRIREARKNAVIDEAEEWAVNQIEALGSHLVPRPTQMTLQLAPSPGFMWTTLPQVICPTLYVRGAESGYVPLELAERMVAVLPHGQLANIPDAGNFSWLDNPPARIADSAFYCN